MSAVSIEGRSGRALALAVAVFVATGCVAAPAASSSAPPASTPPVAPRGSATPPPAGSLSASPTAVPTAAPTATPPAAADPLPNVPAAAAGTWKSIKWTALPTASPLGVNGAHEGSTFQVFGWSRGYIGFAIAPGELVGELLGPSAIVATYSADGVHWHGGQKIDNSGSPAGAPPIVIRSVLEGPGGLVAVGWTGAWGSEYLAALWTSPDGISWAQVDIATAFGVEPVAIANVSGGGAGYVATAFNGRGAWTSADGKTWRAIPASNQAFANSRIDDGTAVSGTFVVAGTVGTADCGATTIEGPMPTPPMKTTTAWWSADGSSWTRVALPGAVARPSNQRVWLAHLTDRAALLVEDVYGVGRTAWGSKDGRAWTPVTLPADVDQRSIVSDGRHDLVVQPVADGPETELKLRTIGDDFSILTLSQAGDVPHPKWAMSWGGPTYGLVAVGPTGVVVTAADGSAVWFGSPSEK